MSILPSTVPGSHTYPRLPPEMCMLTLSMWSLQLVQEMVEWPEVGSQLSFRSAEIKTPSTLRSKLPLVFLKGDKKERVEASTFFPTAV